MCAAYVLVWSSSEMVLTQLRYMVQVGHHTTSPTNVLTQGEGEGGAGGGGGRYLVKLGHKPGEVVYYKWCRFPSKEISGLFILEPLL